MRTAPAASNWKQSCRVTKTPESTMPWPSATNQLFAARLATEVITSPDCAYTVPFDEVGIVPAVNQIELLPYFPQTEQLEVHAQLGIRTESWSHSPDRCQVVSSLGTTCSPVARSK